MDGFRFDGLTRSLATVGSRRRALALALSGALASVVAREDAAAHDARKKCKKKSGQQKKKCRKKARKHNDSHPTSSCTGRPDDAVCPGGKCLQGVCNPTPSCTGGGQPCPTVGQCCVGTCDDEGNTCGRGPVGSVCLTGRDCVSGVCRGHRCADTGCIYNHDYCIFGQGPCHNGGFCLTLLGASPDEGPRCGDNTGSSGICDCTSHQECVDALGAGAFCAQDTGPHCGCSGAATFCVAPR